MYFHVFTQNLTLGGPQLEAGLPYLKQASGSGHQFPPAAPPGADHQAPCEQPLGDLWASLRVQLDQSSDGSCLQSGHRCSL
jgi:hypothetical protein